MSPGGTVPLVAMFEEGPWNESGEELETSPEIRLPNLDFSYLIYGIFCSSRGVKLLKLSLARDSREYL